MTDVNIASPLLSLNGNESACGWNAAFDSLPVGIYACDREGRIVHANLRASKLTGGTPPAVPKESLTEVLKTGRTVQASDIRHEWADGTSTHFLAEIGPLKDDSGSIAGALICLQDITAQKEAEERQQALIGEINHRVKNTLATVQALAAQTLRGDGVVKELRETFGARLMALSRVHDELTRVSWRSADLRSIFRDVFLPYGEGRVLLDGEAVHLPPKTAVALALILHELTNNAAKFGALSTLNGRLSLCWAVDTTALGRMLTVDWVESGGPQVQPPTHRGFGRRLVERGVSGELQGTAELKFEPQGVQCRIKVPLTQTETSH